MIWKIISCNLGFTKFQWPLFKFPFENEALTRGLLFHHIWATIQCFKLWESAIMDQSVAFRKPLYTPDAAHVAVKQSGFLPQGASCLPF